MNREPGGASVKKNKINKNTVKDKMKDKVLQKRGKALLMGLSDWHRWQILTSSLNVTVAVHHSGQSVVFTKKYKRSDSYIFINYWRNSSHKLHSATNSSLKKKWTSFINFVSTSKDLCQSSVMVAHQAVNHESTQKLIFSTNVSPNWKRTGIKHVFIVSVPLSRQ